MRARLVGLKAFAGWQEDDCWVMVPVGTEGEASPVEGFSFRVHDFVTDDGVCVPVHSSNYEAIS